MAGLFGLASCITSWGLLELYPGFGHHVKNGPPADHAGPHEALVTISTVEGFAAGAVLCCVGSVMLPEAFEKMEGGHHDEPDDSGNSGNRRAFTDEHSEDESHEESSSNFIFSAGFLCTAGFMFAVLIEIMYP